MATSLSFYLLAWSPVLVLGAFGTAEQTAYYSVAARVAAFVSVVPSIQSSYLSPGFAKLFGARRIAALGNMAANASAWASGVGALVVLPVLLAPELVLKLFGDGYVGAKPALTILSLTALIQVLIGPVTPLMMTCRLEVYASYLTTLAVVLSFGLGSLASGFGAGVLASAMAVLGIGYSIAGMVILRRRGIRTSFFLPLKGEQRV